MKLKWVKALKVTVWKGIKHIIIMTSAVKVLMQQCSATYQLTGHLTSSVVGYFVLAFHQKFTQAIIIK